MNAIGNLMFDGNLKFDEFGLDFVYVYALFNISKKRNGIFRLLKPEPNCEHTNTFTTYLQICDTLKLGSS